MTHGGARASRPPGDAPARAAWWRRAVIYQVYLRSFADGNGDGLGDIPGLRSRLPYLRDLGADAVWITPWYPSPMADGGYDVADHRDVDPRFGSLVDAEGLIEDAHALGLRVILDIVPNHTSDRHPWFRAALAAGPGSQARARYWFRDGRGPTGEQPPTDWTSVFGGPAWTRVTESGGRPGQWYLHLFAPEQPDLDWEHPDVAADFERTLRFWFDRGVDGFRIDVATSLFKDRGLPDVGAGPQGWGAPDAPGRHPFWDRDPVHGVWRRWRAIADEYDPPRVFVGEVVASPERLARYVRPDELQTVFNFDFLKAPWSADDYRRVIDTTLAALAAEGAPATWVLSNHDEPRHLTRFGWPDTGWRLFGAGEQGTPNLVLGTRRARAAALLLLALPGGAYVYQGEELGLEQVLDIPEDLLEDPTWERSGHTVRGRDGCRVPIPWSGDRAPFGFGSAGSLPWLPQPASWAAKTAEAEAADPGSMLALYREALRLRRAEAGLAGETFRWLASPPGTLAFERGAGFACAVNLSGEPLHMPPARTTLLRSDGAIWGESAAGDLPPDAAEWFRP